MIALNTNAHIVLNGIVPQFQESRICQSANLKSLIGSLPSLNRNHCWRNKPPIGQAKCETNLSIVSIAMLHLCYLTDRTRYGTRRNSEKTAHQNRKIIRNNYSARQSFSGDPKITDDQNSFSLHRFTITTAF